MTTIGPMHLGEVLLEDFLIEMNLNQNRLAVAIDIPARRINEIVRGQRRVTARLGRYVGTSAEFRLSLQTRFDFQTEQDHLSPVLDAIKPQRAK